MFHLQIVYWFKAKFCLWDTPPFWLNKVIYSLPLNS